MNFSIVEIIFYTSILLLTLFSITYCIIGNSKMMRAVFSIYLIIISMAFGIVINDQVKIKYDKKVNDEVHKKAEEQAVSPKMIAIAIKELNVTKSEAEDIFWRCAALECDPEFAFQLLDPSLSNKEAEYLVYKVDKN